MNQALALTAFLLLWAVLWGKLHTRIRKDRSYATDKRVAAVGPDALYRRLNPILFMTQVVVSIACTWSHAAWLLPFHSQLSLRWVGASLLAVALGLTWFALRHLRENYSPCYDSHLPRRLVTTGPYASIRHPMYLAKLMAGAGIQLLSGSLWLLPSIAYLFVSTIRAVRREDAELVETLPGYATYATRTRLLIPFCR